MDYSDFSIAACPMDGGLLLDRKLRKTGRSYTEITPLDRLSLIGTDLKPETSFWKAVKEQLNEE